MPGADTAADRLATEPASQADQVMVLHRPSQHLRAVRFCCRWIIPSTLIQDFARSACPPSAAARALSRAIVAASVPCTSIMSQASAELSAPSAMTVTSLIVAFSEAASFPGNSMERLKHDQCRQKAQADQDRNDNWQNDL